MADSSQDSPQSQMVRVQIPRFTRGSPYISTRSRFTARVRNTNAIFSCEMNLLPSVHLPLEFTLPIAILDARNDLISKFNRVLPHKRVRRLNLRLEHPQLGNDFDICVFHERDLNGVVRRYLSQNQIDGVSPSRIFTVRLAALFASSH